jgi:hypothetical protein
LIRKIGLIYQDGNSLGFMRGMQARLNCDAEIISPPTAVGKSRNLTPRQAKDAWLEFQKQGVDLVVRFTDADEDRWQDVRRRELDVLADHFPEMLICGVAVENTEHWLCLDRPYLCECIEIDVADLGDLQHRTARIKNAIRRSLRGDDKLADVVERIVRNAPRQVFRRWLTSDDSLREFYRDCRAAAIRAGCEDAPNELESDDET